MSESDIKQAAGSTAADNAKIDISDECAIAAALLTVGGVADRAMVCRTQRRVRERAAEIVERRRVTRHGVGLAVLCVSLLLLVLTPVLWAGFHLLHDQGWSASVSIEMQCMYVIGWLFPVTAVGLALGCMRVRAGRETR